jgi:hypothetical protein
VPQGPFPRPAGPLPRLTRPGVTPQAPSAPQSSAAPTVRRQAPAATTPMSHRGCPGHTVVTSLLFRSRGVARSPGTAALTSSLSPQWSACSREKRWRSWYVPLYGARGTRTPPRAHGRSGLVAHGPRSTGPGAHAPHTERTIPGQTTATHPKVWAECRIHGFHFSRSWSGMCRNMPIWNRSERSPHFPWRWEIGPPGPFFRAAPLPLSLRRTGAPERASYQAKARRRPTYPHMRSLEIAVRKGFTGTSRPFI